MKSERKSKPLGLAPFFPSLCVRWESDAVSVRTVGKHARPIQTTAPLACSGDTARSRDVACRARCAKSKRGGKTFGDVERDAVIRPLGIADAETGSCGGDGWDRANERDEADRGDKGAGGAGEKREDDGDGEYEGE
jgi:hypothetical protein